MDAPKLWSNKTTGKSLITSPPIPEERKCSIQQIIGTFLYYARAVNWTMLRALNTLAEQQSSTTKKTEAAITHFLDYAATNPSDIILYNLAIWYFTLTLMYHNYQSHGHTATMEDTITWDHYQPTQQKLQTSHHQQMAQSIWNVES